MDRGWLIVEPSSRQIVVGCGEDASVEEASTFVDIVARHRGAAEVIHTRVEESIEAHFSRSLEDDALISGRSPERSTPSPRNHTKGGPDKKVLSDKRELPRR